METVRWEYPDRIVVLHFFDCRHESGPIVPREEQAMEWAEPARLADYDFRRPTASLSSDLAAAPG